jgi:arylsulfatase A-like enzyme
MRAAYYASISFIDWNLGRILAALGDEINNTLVLFTSDHGELLGDYGSFGKRCMLEPSVRVPLIVRQPGTFPAGLVCDAPSSLLDLLPTFLAAAGESRREGQSEGQDLAQLVQYPASPRYVYSQFSEARFGLYLITDGRWKYSYSAADDQEWLFDLSADPHETHNLALNPAFNRQVRQLRQRIIERFQQDHYDAALDGDDWRRYPTYQMPNDPDYGLLYQDPPQTQSLIDDLGEYARRVTVPAGVGEKILSDTQQGKAAPLYSE